MNILDFAFLLLFALVILVCCYQGFLRSVFTFIVFFLACIIAFIFSPLVSNGLANNPYLETAIISYTEGAEMLNEDDAQLARVPISQLSPEQIHSMIERGKFPEPIGSMVEKNVFAKSFEANNISQLSDYISHTFSSFVLNVLAFWILFFIVFVLGVIVIAVLDHASPFLVLRKFDRLAASGVGIVLSIGLSLLLALFIPIVLFAVGQQLSVVQKLVDESFFASFFYRFNFLFSLIRST